MKKNDLFIISTFKYGLVLSIQIAKVIFFNVDDIRVVPGPGSNPQKDSDIEDSTISIIHVNTNNAGKDLSGVKKDFPMPPFSMIELIMIR